MSFKRISTELPGFKYSFTARDGARQFRELFERIQMSPDTYQFRAFTRLKQLKYLQATKQIDSEFYWS